ncbi:MULTISPECIES: hypothetical protein [Sphingobium]|uniref:hypothetical protein n=1 Tax=Sphingobium TaxID=165695 RepID=UPI00159C82C4
MRAGQTLFPMMLLALLAGCAPAPGKRANAEEGTTRQPTLSDSSMTQDAPPPREAAATASAPAILPDIDPALADMQAAREKEPKAPRPASSDPVRTAPIKPSPVDMPAPVPDLPPADGAADARPFPDEVTRYMVDRDSCDHFRGEEAYDAERLAYLQENIAELCTGTDTRLALLRQLYAHDPAVISALSGYDERIEGNASQ